MPDQINSKWNRLSQDKRKKLTINRQRLKKHQLLEAKEKAAVTVHKIKRKLLSKSNKLRYLRICSFNMLKVGSNRMSLMGSRKTKLRLFTVQMQNKRISVNNHQIHLIKEIHLKYQIILKNAKMHRRIWRIVP